MINWPSTIGLLLDIIGVILLFAFVIQPESFGYMREEGPSEAEQETEARKTKFWAYIGLGLVVLGFILQLIGTNLTFFRGC
jgi:uncharacterized membrane protein